MKVLFICRGNSCRSPMAETILKHRRPDWEVSSAGFELDGSASENCKAVLAEVGLPAPAEPRPIPSNIDGFDFIVVLTLASDVEKLPERVRRRVEVWPFADPHDEPIAVYRELLHGLSHRINQVLNGEWEVLSDER